MEDAVWIGIRLEHLLQLFCNYLNCIGPFTGEASRTNMKFVPVDVGSRTTSRDVRDHYRLPTSGYPRFTYSLKSREKDRTVIRRDMRDTSIANGTSGFDL